MTGWVWMKDQMGSFKLRLSLSPCLPRKQKASKMDPFGQRSFLSKVKGTSSSSSKHNIEFNNYFKKKSNESLESNELLEGGQSPTREKGDRNQERGDRNQVSHDESHEFSNSNDWRNDFDIIPETARNFIPETARATRSALFSIEQFDAKKITNLFAEENTALKDQSLDEHVCVSCRALTIDIALLFL